MKNLMTGSSNDLISMRGYTSMKPYKKMQILTPKVYIPDSYQIECLAFLELEPIELEKSI